MRITIWEKATGRALLSELLSVTEINKRLIAPIFPLEVKKGVEYIVSTNATQMYAASRGGALAPYPFTVGNLVIPGFYFLSGSLNTMPTGATENTLFGPVSVIYQRSE